MQKLFKRNNFNINSNCCYLCVRFACTGKIDGNGALVYKSDNSSTFDPGGLHYSRIYA